jgi:hypothetical protein
MNSAGYDTSYFEDPVQIDVNSVRTSVGWWWNPDGFLVEERRLPEVLSFHTDLRRTKN